MRAGSAGSYVVGAFAGVAAIAVCIGAAILANHPVVIQALSLPEWLPGLVAVVAVLLVVIVAVAAAVALVPRRWQ
jgi:hypothetical protein